MSFFRGLSSSSESEEESVLHCRIARKKAEKKEAEKKRIWPPPDDSSSEEEEASVGEEMTDTEAAVWALRPKNLHPPVVFRHHVYCEIHDRSIVDRELDQLARKKRVRLLQLPTAPDDIGIFLADDWNEETAKAKRRAGQSTGSIIDAFEPLSMQLGAELYLTRTELAEAFAKSRIALSTALNALLGLGLLRPRRDPSDRTETSSFWFSCPRFGETARRLQHARAAITKALKSARYNQLQIYIDRNKDQTSHEISQSNTKKRKRKIDSTPSLSSNLPGSSSKRTLATNNILNQLDDPNSSNYVGGLNFHVRDLVGKGMATLEHRSNGRFLRLVLPPPSS